MATQRTHVVFPADLLADIDREVGPRGRSAFLAELAQKEIKKRKLLAILNDPEPSWKEEDHPELADGAYQWVRSMRDQDERRFERLNAQRDGE